MADSAFRRRALPEAERRLAAARIVVVNGPRQAGKSWLLRRLAEAHLGLYLSLDEAANLRGARTDSAGFVVRDAGRPMLIDEVQRGGEQLVLAIKAAADASDERGQYVLAGSTRFLTEPRLSESLAGRARFVDLWPLSQGEIDGHDDGDRFLAAAVVGYEAIAELGARAEALDRAAVFARVTRGGFPEAVRATERDRTDFFADYVRTVSQRDITELGRITDRVDLPAVLRLLAARSAGELNMTDLANDAGLGRDTARRYLPLVEAIFLVVRLPGWSPKLVGATRIRPKIHLTDPGLAAWLCRVTSTDLARPGHPMDGALLESFVVGELLRQQTWTPGPVWLGHWREPAGREVDIVVDCGPRHVVGVEVKAAVDVSERDFRHLAHLRDRLGDRFACGVVLHCGTRLRRFGDRMLALPVSALWQP